MGNNRFFLLLSMICCTAAFCTGIPKIHYDLQDDSAMVEPTGVWEKVASPGVQNNVSTPHGMLAYSISENNILFNWKPSSDTSRLSGQADIVGALLTLDESLLVIAEQVGGTGRPNSTRLVFVNVINNKICGGMMLDKRRVKKIITIPGMSNKILAVQEAQSVFQNRNALLVIDLKRKRITQAGPGFDQPINSVCTDGTSAWVSFENNNSFAEIDLEDPDKKPRYCDAKKPVLSLVYNPNSRNIIAIGSGICEFFSINRHALFLEKSLMLPDNFTTVWELGLPNLPNGVLVQNKDGKGLVVTSGGVVPIAARLEPYGCMLSDRTLLAGTADRSRIDNITLPDCAVSRYFAPSSLRPFSRNKTIFIFPRTTSPQEIIILDERGNVFKLALSGRRGRKTVLLLTDRTGVR